MYIGSLIQVAYLINWPKLSIGNSRLVYSV
jgi:hypothetical protein